MLPNDCPVMLRYIYMEKPIFIILIKQLLYMKVYFTGRVRTSRFRRSTKDDRP